MAMLLSRSFRRKLLATARFVEGDPIGALDAWNQAGEPRVDLVQIDGLQRTRHRVVEGLLAVEQGQVLKVIVRP